MGCPGSNTLSQWNLLVDVKKCVGCYNCFLACKDEHIGNNHEGYSRPQPSHGHQWIDIDVVERGQAPMIDLTYVPKMCNHCDNAPCMKVGGDAVEKRSDGIVIINPEKAEGRKDIVEACPYGAIFWNEEEQIPQSWYFDAHLLDRGWKEPRCVQSCATGALTSHKISDKEMSKMAAQEKLTVLKPELGTKPRVYYKNLALVESCFIGGSLVRENECVKDCAKGVTVKLRQDARVLACEETDAFGEFKFDGLPPNGGDYEIEFLVEGKIHNVMSVVLREDSINLGTVDLVLTS